MDIKSELNEIEKFVKSGKIGIYLIERRPNGTLHIEIKETKQYKDEYANNKAAELRKQKTIE